MWVGTVTAGYPLVFHCLRQTDSETVHWQLQSNGASMRSVMFIHSEKFSQFVLQRISLSGISTSCYCQFCVKMCILLLYLWENNGILQKVYS